MYHSTSRSVPSLMCLLQFHLFVPFVTSQEQSKIARMASVVSLCDTSLAQLPVEMAKFAAREQVLLLGEPIIGALCTFYRYLAEQSHRSDTIVELLTHQIQFHFSDSSHPTLEVDPFTEKTIVWNHSSTSTSPGSSIPVKPH